MPFLTKCQTNIKLNKTKISKIIQLVGPFCSLLANSGK